VKATVNSSVAESTATYSYVKPEPNGFKIQSGQSRVNASGETYIYIAIRRGPMAVPTDATDVFGIDTRTGDRPSFTSNFVTDFALARDASQTWEWVVAQRLTQGKIFEGTNDTDAEYSSSSFKFDYQDGYAGLNGSNANYYSWMWKRAPSYFDVVAYTGNGTAGRTVSHNLGVAPEMMWVKGRDVVDEWHIYHSGIDRDGDGAPETDYAIFNSVQPNDSVTIWNDTAPTDSVFTLGTNGGVNGSGSTYIAYLFASVDGVSKVGSYTGDGNTSQNIDCGFSAGARFILVKATSKTSNWLVVDTTRGLDERLWIDDTSAEETHDYIDAYSGGFAVKNTYGLFNQSGASYIFYAVA